MTIYREQASLGFLLVEDDTVAAIDLECILEDMGHRVVAVAVAASSAVDTLIRQGGEIDAVVFGATLVGLPAFSLSRFLDQAGCPAIVTSAQPESVIRALGFVEPYLAKPVMTRDVERLVGDLEKRAFAGAA